MRAVLLVLSLVALLPSSARGQSSGSPPVATNDTLPAVEDQTLVIEASTLLANDTDADGNTLRVALASQPAHGTLTVMEDGRLQYVPNPDYFGQDQFTYRAVEIAPPASLEIDTLTSGIRLDVGFSASGLSDSDSDSTSLRGTMAIDLAPGSPPFQQIHVTDVAARFADGLAFRFRFGFLGNINASVDPDSMQLRLVEPGAAAALDAGMFLQAGNTVALTGIINASGTGIFTNLVPTDPQAIDESQMADFGGQLTVQGNDVSVDMPVAFQGQVSTEDFTLDLDLSGRIVASAPFADGLASQQATVTITVEAVDDPPVAPVIVAPQAGASIVLEGDPGETVHFEWEADPDPDGETITYVWQLAADPQFATVLASVDAGTDTHVDLSLDFLAGAVADDGVSVPGDAATFYHRAVASDATTATAGAAAQVVVTRGMITGSEPTTTVPDHFVLGQNYPNPFNPSTVVTYALPRAAGVTLTVFDAQGRVVAMPLRGVQQAAGTYHVTFDAGALPSGPYFYRLQADAFNDTKMMILLR